MKNENAEKHPNRVICPKCGEKGTRILKKIKGHGPYWYVIHRVPEKKHPTPCYIGKTWPSEKERRMG